MRSLILAVVLAGCGGAVPADCLVFNVQEQVESADMTYNVDLARSMLAPFVAGNKFCAQFQTIQFEIVAVEDWNCRPVNPECKEACTMACTEGLFIPGHIRLNRNMDGLVHELLHALQYAENREINHEGWDENGYYEIDRLFQERRLTIVKE